MPPLITSDELKARLSYDPETGFFTWLIKPCAQVEIGDRAGTLHNEGYRQINVLGRLYLEHRLAWFWMTGKWPAKLIDHRNKNRSDNHWLNLREATKSTNAANSNIRKNNTSGVKGVRPVGRRWRAAICINRKKIHLGYFQTKEEAAFAYGVAAEQYFGEFVA